jgi:hypothetical protein
LSSTFLLLGRSVKVYDDERGVYGFVELEIMGDSEELESVKLYNNL